MRASGCGNLEANFGGGRWRRYSLRGLCISRVRRRAPDWDLMYFIEAMNKSGNGQIHPDLNRETPYIIVHLQR